MDWLQMGTDNFADIKPGAMKPPAAEKTERSAPGNMESGDRKALIKKLLGNAESTALEHKIFNTLLLLVSFTGLFTTISNITLEVPLPQVVITAVCTLMAIVAYIYSQVTKLYQVMTTPLAIFFYCALIVAFFVNNGTYGGAPYFFFILIVPVIVLTPKLFQKKFIAFVFITIVLMIASEYFFPGMLIGYDNRIQQYFDIGTSLIICMGIVTFMVNSVFTRYLEERRLKDKLLEQAIKDKEEIENAFREIKILRGFLPICSECKNIRDDKGYWKKIELYIREHSEAEFSHGICPECLLKLYPELYSERTIQ